ncbi:MAG: DnaA ATPase domain-containing protein [Planctomycetota bacterium]|jgi:chromosomal replication initiator protein
MSATLSEMTAATRITNRVKEHIGDEQYDKYLVDSVSIRVDGDGVHVLTPTSFDASWISRRFGSAILDAARTELGITDCALTFETDPAQFPGRQTARASMQEQTQRDPSSDVSVRRERRSTPRLRYALETFEVGNSNRLAHGAVRALLSDRSDPGLSPLFVHGDCGVGKTHLLQGFAGAFLKSRPGSRVKYVDGESFTNGFVSSLRANSVDSFRRAYRDLDLLCIDDVHFLANKTATQKEFLHTFNALGLKGATIALASDSHPSLIEAFSKELSSRFLSGMVVKVDTPDEELREKLVRRMGAMRGLVLDDAAVSLVSWHGRESVRMLESALTRLGAVASIDPPAGAMDAAYVRRALGQTTRPAHSRPIRLETLVRHVVSELGVELSDVLGRSRHRRVVMARSMAGMLARRMTTCSYPEIARALGRPSHSTVVSAVKRLEEQFADGARFGCGGAHDGMLLEDVLGSLERSLHEA